MNPNDPNVRLVDEVAGALGDLWARVVLVGGAAVGFLVTDPGQPRIRATTDVDVVVETPALSDYYALERELEQRGLKHDTREDAPICRWVIGPALLDLMPASVDLLGFANPWYPHALKSAEAHLLPSGRTVRIVDAPTFLATKLTAFDDRGIGDYMASHDMEDILAVLDGRSELADEIRTTAPEVREFLALRFGAMLAEPRFLQALPGHLPPDNASQARLPDLEQKLRKIAGLVRY